jgi:hypothetical protein
MSRSNMVIMVCCWLLIALNLMVKMVGTYESIFNSFLVPPGTICDSSRFCLKFSSLFTFQRTFYT